MMIAVRKSIVKVPQCMNRVIKNVSVPLHFHVPTTGILVDNVKSQSIASTRFFSADSPSQNKVTKLPDPSTVLEYNEDIKSMSNQDLTDITTIPGFTTLIHSMPKDDATPRNALVGKVVSDKMQKTVNVAVDRYRIIPKYRKRKKYTKKFFAHDEHEVCATGDLVMIVPCQRLSRHKHFMVREIIRRKGTGSDE